MSIPPMNTLTTDFGIGSSCVVANKGVLLTIHPEVRLVDLSHAIELRQIGQTAILLAETALLFPPDTVHLAVVDPGVGTSCRIVAVNSFGNLVTNITGGQLEDLPTDTRLAVLCEGHETRGLFSVCADQPAMALIALVGSNGHLELAIVGNHAARMLGARVGAKVVVEW